MSGSASILIQFPQTNPTFIVEFILSEVAALRKFGQPILWWSEKSGFIKEPSEIVPIVVIIYDITTKLVI